MPGLAVLSQRLWGLTFGIPYRISHLSSLALEKIATTCSRVIPHAFSASVKMPPILCEDGSEGGIDEIVPSANLALVEEPGGGEGFEVFGMTEGQSFCHDIPSSSDDMELVTWLVILDPKS